MPKTLESFVEILNMYGDVDFIHGRMSFFSDGDDVLREQPLYIDNNWNEGIATGQRLFADAFRHQGAIAMGVRGLYNREFLLKNELFFVEKNCSWPEDEEWTPRVFQKAKKAAGNHNAYYCYREGRRDSESSKLFNLQTGLVTVDIYQNWYKVVKDIGGLESDYIKYIAREAGRRFIWLISGCSKKLSKNDIDQFLSYASEGKKLAMHINKISPRCVLLKWMIILFGVRNAGLVVRIAENFKKKRDNRC